MKYLRKNFAFGTLASDISDVDTQVTLNAGHTLPTAAGSFPLVIWDNVTYPDPAEDPNLEITVASYSGTPNVYNITRGQEDTLAVSHSAGNKAALHYTAKMSEEDLYESSDFDVDFSNKTLDDLAAGTTNVHLTSTLKSNYDTAYSHSTLVLGNPHNVTASDLGLGASDEPTFAGLTLTGLTPSRLVATDANSILISSDLNNWIAGTTNQINITDDGDGTITLSTPQDIHVGASPTFNKVILSSLNTNEFVITNASKELISTDTLDFGNSV